jgi:hypothetical protein
MFYLHINLCKRNLNLQRATQNMAPPFSIPDPPPRVSYTPEFFLLRAGCLGMLSSNIYIWNRFRLLSGEDQRNRI